MIRKAIYAGSFDPFTIGHHDIVLRSLKVVDELIILVGVNPEKHYFMSESERLSHICQVYRNEERVSVVAYHGLTGHYALEHGANLLLRGIRNVGDMEYERNMAEFNKKHFALETLFLFSSPELCAVSSSLVRQLAVFGEDYEAYLPEIDDE